MLLDRISQVQLSSRGLRWPLLLAAAWLMLVAVTDAFTPLGFAHGVLYIPAILLTVWARQPWCIWVVTGAALALTVVGVMFAPPPPPDIAMRVVWANRVLALAMLGLMGALSHVMLLSFQRWRSLRDAEIAQKLEIEQRASADLARSAADWQALAESMPLLVWTTTPEGKLLYCSAAWQPTLADSLAAPVQAWHDLVHPDDLDSVRQAWQASVLARSRHQSEARMRQPDGSYRWMLNQAHFVQGREARWFGSSLDIHDRRLLEQAARQTAERLTATMESVTDGILLLDLQWRVVYANARAATLLQRHPEQWLKQPLWQMYPEWQAAAVGQACAQTLADGQHRQAEILIPEGQRCYEVQVYRSHEGLALYLRDVTTQRALAGQLQRSQRLESLGQLTGGVAHDFNNLLTVILGNTDLLRDQAAEGSNERQLLTQIAQAAQRGSDLTQRLLAFARRQPLAPVAVDLNRMLAEIEPLVRRASGDAVALEPVRAGGLWLTRVDPAQLESAVLNLVFNARDAMPQGGRLTLETANAWLDDDYVRRHDGLAAGQYVMLAVTDTGTGMPPERVSHAFEPFFTTKPLGQGTGLGLAMVYGFVKQSGGHVAIYSEEGKGTTVKMYFPRLHAAAAATATVIEDPVAQGDGRVVLLVEDDAMVRAYARSQLRSLGYRVIEAADGEAALAVVQSTQPLDLLFTDVVMPGLSGPQLAQQVQALRPGLPVLFTSGYTDNALLHQGRLEPGVLLLSKPYRRAELSRKLQMALAPSGSANPASVTPRPL